MPDRIESVATDADWMDAAITFSKLAPRVGDRYAVGAIVVDYDGSILATGYTGETDPHEHAEEAALAKIAPGTDLSRATIYTTMEPCTSRRSRPASCTELVVAAGLRRVVLALREPLVFADCDGVGTLVRAGVEVVELPGQAGEVRAVNAHVLSPGQAG
ncbi:deaminase [Actinoplanes sp. NPDC023714]|uniref:deaminase n=1 Tax=Actinoplanes sp. NPDC023714 TaxID=3154322 RepID=UPI0033DCCCE8